MSPDYDDSDLTDEEMIAAAKYAFDDADTATPIPTDPSTSNYRRGGTDGRGHNWVALACRQCRSKRARLHLDRFSNTSFG
jgi:hypothetical protein